MTKPGQKPPRALPPHWVEALCGKGIPKGEQTAYLARLFGKSPQTVRLWRRKRTAPVWVVDRVEALTRSGGPSVEVTSAVVIEAIDALRAAAVAVSALRVGMIPADARPVFLGNMESLLDATISKLAPVVPGVRGDWDTARNRLGLSGALARSGATWTQPASQSVTSGPGLTPADALRLKSEVLNLATLTVEPVTMPQCVAPSDAALTLTSLGFALLHSEPDTSGGHHTTLQSRKSRAPSPRHSSK